MSDWIRCSEQMPEENVPVLVNVISRSVPGEASLEEGYPRVEAVTLCRRYGPLAWHEYSEGWPDWCLEDVSHWMPFPEPVKD